MPNLSMREQLLISSMFLIIFVLAGMWGIQQLNRQEKMLLQQLGKLEQQIKQVRFLSRELKDVQRSATVLTNVQKGTEGVKVGLDRLKLDHLMSMLYQLENHRPVLRTSHLSISISPGNRQVRASFQVHKQLGG